MKSFLLDFSARINEIEEYFSFVEFIDSLETHKSEVIKANTKQIVPKRELQKVLRSTSFLLLYNLVESSIRNGILAVYDAIHDDGLTYDQLSERIKEIWLAHQSRQIQGTENSVKKQLKILMDEVSIGNQILLGRDTIYISGNLDYENVQKIINTYGFFGKITVPKEDIEKALNKVKQERNFLAHGNKTFSQSGEIITMPELLNIKLCLNQYLSDLLRNIEFYIDNKKYKK